MLFASFLNMFLKLLESSYCSFISKVFVTIERITSVTEDKNYEII